MSTTASTTPPITSSQTQHWGRLLLGLACLLALAGIGMLVTGSKLPALALLAAAGGLVLMAKPNVATLITTLILYSNAGAVATQFHGIPKLAAAGGFMLLGIPLYYQVVVQRKRIIIDRISVWLLLFAVVQCVTMLTAQRSEVAVGVLITTVSEGLILYLLVINVIRDQLTLRRVVWTMLLAGAFLGGLTTVQHITGDFHNTFGGFAQVPVDDHVAPAAMVYDDAPRAGGPIAEPN